MSDRRTYCSPWKPCPVCHNTHSCCWTPDGLYLCRHHKGNHPNFDWLSKNKGEVPWHEYRKKGHYRDILTPDVRQSAPHPFSSPSSNADSEVIDWSQKAVHFQRSLTDKRREALAAEIGLPVEALARWSLLGSCPSANWWTIPVCQADRNICGLHRRWRGGQKGLMENSQKGLFIPDDFPARPGPIGICEGWSDTAALASCGFAVVGRHDKTHGKEMLAELLAPLGRDIVIIADRDFEDGEDESSLDPVLDLYDYLAPRIRPCWTTIFVPPEPFKDARQLVLAGRVDAFARLAR